MQVVQLNQPSASFEKKDVCTPETKSGMEMRAKRLKKSGSAESSPNHRLERNYSIPWIDELLPEIHYRIFNSSDTMHRFDSKVLAIEDEEDYGLKQGF